jgi:hypothetical protein
MFANPDVKVFHIHENATVGPDGRDFPACHHMLNRFFAASDVGGRLLYGEQPRPNGLTRGGTVLS